MTVAAPTRTANARPRSFDWTMPVSATFVLLLGLLVLLPMFWLALTSLRDDAKLFTLGNYRQIFTDPSFLKPLFTTLWTSAAVATLCVFVAAPMAWLVSRTDLPAQRTLRMLILASFVTPPFLGAFAWVLLGGPNAGLLNQWYYAMFGLKPFEAQPLLNIFSAGVMVFVMALYTFPYVFTFVANGLDLIPGELEEASAILGVPAWRTALDVTLPLVTPALLAGFLVAFLQSMTLFGPPAILALPAGIDTMTTKIWSLFRFPPDPARTPEHLHPRALRRDGRNAPGHHHCLSERAAAGLGTSLFVVPRDGAGRDTRHRAGRGAFFELHASAAAALRHARHHLSLLCDQVH